MSATPDRIVAVADRLHQAAAARHTTEQTTRTEAIDLADAYRVQAAVVARRVEAGATPTGLKLGFTSEAKARQMGVNEAILARLTSDMRIADGGSLRLATLIHPRVEPEVAYRFARDVVPGDAGPDRDDFARLLTLVDAVAPALEIIDSRYQDFRFELADVVADNASAAGYVLGPWTEIAQAPDLADEPVSLAFDDEVVARGSTADILGHPHRAIATALGLAARYGVEIHRGDVLLAGAATAAVALTAGTAVTVRAGALGIARVQIADTDAGDRP